MLGVGQSFLSKMENGRESVPEYIPEKLIELFGRDDVERYQKKDGEDDFLLNNSQLTSGNPAPAFDERLRAEQFDRLLLALERRDQLVFLQQKECERQGNRIDELISLLKKQVDKQS